MQLIIVSDRLKQAKSYSLGGTHIALAVGLVMLTIGVLSSLLSYATLHAGSTTDSPMVQGLVAEVAEREQRKHESFVRENINALAVKLGELQAQLLRLDTMSDRLTALAGLKSTRDLRLGDAPGRGGALPTVATRPLSVDDLQRELDSLNVRLDHRGDALRLMEDELLRERARRTLLPSAAPINAPYLVSGFGWRIDPFTGRGGMHEGLDFAAPHGTPILAAAAGIVTAAELHPAYGNLVDIDHGKGMTTRYAHASKLHVKVGEVVKRGQRIADVGSTGHSTGPHLHFEVREHGTAKNPTLFLTTLAQKLAQK